MNWNVIGAGSILPRVGYGCSGYALRPRPGGPVTLFDCGPGSVRSLPSHGIELAEVERVVLSHFHPDHCLDLFALAFARRNPRAACGPIELIGPRGFGAWLEAGSEALGRWVEFDQARVVEVEPSEEPASLTRTPLTFSSARTRHTETAVAWRVDHDGRSITYSGDAREVPELARLARETDLFVCECSGHDDDPPPGHLTPLAAARLARAAGAKRLLLTHFYPHVDPERAREEAATLFDGPIDLARDGLVFEVQ